MDFQLVSRLFFNFLVFNKLINNFGTQNGLKLILPTLLSPFIYRDNLIRSSQVIPSCVPAFRLHRIGIELVHVKRTPKPLNTSSSTVNSTTSYDHQYFTPAETSHGLLLYFSSLQLPATSIT